MTLKEYLAATVRRHWHSVDQRLIGLRNWAASSGLIEVVELASGKVVPVSETWTCPNCDRILHERGSNTGEVEMLYGVYRHISISDGGELESERCCRNCIANDAFNCTISGGYYLNDAFTQVELHNGKYACLEVNKDSLAKHPDGSYVDSTRTAGYHHGYRPWAEPGSERVYGVELEILCSTKRNALTEVRRAAIENGLAAERDGSLDGDYGLEVVGPPLTYQEITDPNGQWGRFLSEIQGKAVGWDAGTNYGMHVNLNVKTFSLNQASKYMSFICHNAKLVAAVAGRTHTQHCQAVHASKSGGLKAAVVHYGGRIRNLLTSRGIISGISKSGQLSWNMGMASNLSPNVTDKYLACSFREGERIEVRCFRSTTRWDRFKRNIQFSASVQAYIEQASNLTYLDPVKYLEWVSENQHHYPELCSFLYTRRDWGSLMPVPPRKNILEMQAYSAEDSDNAKRTPIVRPTKSALVTA